MSTDSPKVELAKAPLLAEGGPFAWVKPAFKSRRTLKTLARCSAAFAATMILLVARKPDETMGQAAFISLIVAVIVPPSLALSIFFCAGATILLGMLLGWAWGNAAMAAALAARNSTFLAQQEYKMAQSIDPTQNIYFQTRYFIFHGHFLDPRSSAVYGVFLFFGAFALGALRAYLPNLSVFMIFASIVLDVICVTGPMLPTANYTLAKLFLIPGSFYVAVGLASLVLVFPESLSHVWVTALTELFWNPVLEILRLQSEALSLTPSDTNKWAEMNTKGYGIREELVTGYSEVTTQMKFLNLDTSIGRLAPSDLRRINAELKSVMFHASGLHAFSSFVNDTNKLETKELNATTGSTTSGTQASRAPNPYQALLSKTKERELKHGHDLDSLVPILRLSSANVRASMESALLCIIAWLQECNSHRLTGLFRRKDPAEAQRRQEKLVEQLAALEDALAEFRLVERVKMIKPYERFFNPETKLLAKDADMFASRSLYICFVFIATLDAFAERMVDVLKIIVDIDAQRPTVRVWFPGRIVSIAENIMGNDFQGLENPFGIGISLDPESFDTTTSSGDDSDSTSSDDEEEKRDEKATRADKKKTKNDRMAGASKKRNPDAFPPKTKAGRWLHKLAPIFRFFKAPQGILALRSGFVSIALWIPAVCHSSAWFYYDNKGVWALIMAQTGLAMYSGNQIAGFVVRFSGTVLGLIIGMVVWYIGAGLGHGNAYGIVVASTVAMTPLYMARIAAPPTQIPFWIMTGVTAVLVIGYSWVNTHQLIIANTGTGYSVGWKRALLVIIGFAAAFIVMIFPKPISARYLVRRTLAAIGGEVGNVFGVEIGAFLADEVRAANCDGRISSALSVEQKDKRVKRITERVIVVAERLRFIKPSFTTAKFEPQLAGTWPHDLYKELFTTQIRMLGALGILITTFSKLNEKWMNVLLHKSAYLNPNFLSDIFMTLTIVSNALKSGHPLPAQLPRLRDRLIYHEYHSGGRYLSSLLVKSSNPPSDAHNGNEESLKTDVTAEVKGTRRSESDTETSREALETSHIDGTNMNFDYDQLTLDVLFNEQLPIYSTAIVAFSSLVSRIDDMADIVRTLCGETTFHGYEALRQDYLDREERTIGGSGFALGH